MCGQIGARPRGISRLLPAAMAEMQRRRRVKVLIKLFQKFAWCGAELHGLKTGAAGGRVQRTGRIRPTGGSPESGLCGTPRGGHSSPLFWSMGRRWLRPRTPVRSWGFTPNPTTFEKVDETFTRLRRGRALAVSTGAAVAAAPKRVLRAQALRRLSLPQQAQGLHQLFLLHAAQLRGLHSLLQVLLHLAQLLFL